MSTEKDKGSEPRNPDKDEDFGYSYYPSRSQNNNADEKVSKSKGWWQRINEGRGVKYELSCASNVKQCVEHNKLIKVLISALKKNGCDFDPRRHVSCEDCVSKVNGGYDPTNNQIVVCQNTSTDKRSCCSVITHELIHMFDFCRAKVNFQNLEHLACTEIRAAAFMHCRFLTAMTEGDASFVNFKNKHQDCVKRKAMMSILMVRNVKYEDASAAVEKVFQRCYKDLEPFGRIPRVGSTDPEKILVESFLHGYGE